jgi:hypothetical protein
MISASLDELPEEHLIVITIEQPDGDTVEFGRIILGPGEVPAETDPAVPLNLLQVIPIGGYAFAAAGVYRVLVQLDDDEPVVLGLSVLGTDGDPTVGEDEITEE